jgi:hypothetical protein
VRELEQLAGFAPDWVPRTPADATAALLQEKRRQKRILLPSMPFTGGGLGHL